MSELDQIKETIHQLRLWLGIFVVTDISLIGWAFSNYGQAKDLLILLALTAIIVVTGAIIFINRRIGAAIERLGEL